jgi:surface antigen
MYMEKSTKHTLENVPTGNTVGWRNPDSGNSGEMTVVKTREPEPGIYCREYQQTITVGGRTEEAFGKACRKKDGTWEVVNN